MRKWLIALLMLLCVSSASAQEKIYTSGDIQLVYSETAGATANKTYLTAWNADGVLADITRRRVPINLYGSADGVGNLEISSAVFDAASSTVLESGTDTATAQRGGTDACTNSSTARGGTDACSNGAPSATAVQADTATFSTDLVVAGDIVVNTTTGERAVVVSVTNETNLVSTAITSNYTALDDLEVYAADAVGTALAAATATFEADSVVVGDTVYNATTGEKAHVETITDETNLVTTQVTQGWIVDDDIEVYSFSLTTLTDSAATFVTNLVYPGCILSNDTTSETARVDSITSETVLVCSGLASGLSYADEYEVINPWTFTLVASQEIAVVKEFNDDMWLPWAEGYLVNLAGGGRITVTYKTR